MVSSSPAFSDIQNHWANSFISALLTRSIVSGFPNGTFRPDQVMTRAEFAAILQKAFSRPKIRQYTGFDDVKASFWGAGAILNAFETGFLSGFPNKRFLPQENVTRVQVLVSLVNGLKIPSIVGVDASILSLSDFYKDTLQIPAYATDAITVATFANMVVNYPDVKIFNPNRGATRGEVAAFIYQALVCLGQAPAINSDYAVAVGNPKVINRGSKVSLNGISSSFPWIQWSYGNAPRTGISDVAALQLFGVNLLSTSDAKKQPISWFSNESNPLILPTFFDETNRYLDISALIKNNNWPVQIDGENLNITTQPATVDKGNFEDRSPIYRITVELNQPAPVQVRMQNNEWTATIEGIATPQLLELFKITPIDTPKPSNTNPTPTGDKNEGETGVKIDKPLQPVAATSNNQTTLRGYLPDGFGVRLYTNTNPYQVIIELRTDALVERDIAWNNSLRWRQQFITNNSDRFPVYSVTVNLRSPEVILRPIWAKPDSMTGTSSLVQMAQKWQVLAAVNGGFFNRNNVLPLGAIRRDGKWLSGPNFNRGAIAWNDQGVVKIARLVLQETVVLATGQRYTVVALNSGFVKAGIGRYTPEWGANYMPVADNEIVVTVQNNQVTKQVQAGAISSKTTYPIPPDGYLLILRSFGSVSNLFNSGAKVTIETATVPPEFSDFPHILGGGPVLLLDGKNVLDAATEGFSDAYVKQAAIRSCLGVTSAGELIIAAIHNRAGGRGATFAETAQIMLQLGVSDALNLDGGSSTSLYLGGQLVNRLPETAAKVHNGLGVFKSSLS